ncbi:MAG: hypothetical protein WBX01_05015 [Nitrososphaeraceae archaeon]
MVQICNFCFPLNVLCSNSGSQANGKENRVSVAYAEQQEEEEHKSGKSYGPPFPQRYLMILMFMGSPCVASAIIHTATIYIVNHK